VAILITVLAVALVVVVILVVSAPLRAAWTSTGAEPAKGRGPRGRERTGEDEAESVEAERGEDRIALEAAREAKYREIRDTELDYRTGKLSQEDFAATDSALRAEAVEILNRLTALDESD
jgi:hypothetical protein